jgi:phthalate 4,5-cis-dihydrodiol dehydrogenase
MTTEGVAVYASDGLKMVQPREGRGVPGRGAVIDELYFAVTEGRPLVHHGRWAKASLEVCLAILESARSHREVAMSWQVPTVDRDSLESVTMKASQS